MAKYQVVLKEVVLLEGVVEAASEEDAQEKAANQDILEYVKQWNEIVECYEVKDALSRKQSTRSTCT